jgi:hypothetical protein
MKRHAGEYLKKVSRLLCPPPSIQNGLARYAIGKASNKSSALLNGTTSSRVPWMSKTLQVMLAIRSMLGNISKKSEKRKGNTTRSTDDIGLYMA